jgi:hypothetical protein
MVREPFEMSFAIEEASRRLVPLSPLVTALDAAQRSNAMCAWYCLRPPVALEWRRDLGAITMRIMGIVALGAAAAGDLIVVLRKGLEVSSPLLKGDGQ